VDKKKWLQFFWYALASCIGLYLDLNFPMIKGMLCQPLNLGGQIDENYQDPRDYRTPTLDRPDL
jgi:hypothetical protein